MRRGCRCSGQIFRESVHGAPPQRHHGQGRVLLGAGREGAGIGDQLSAEEAYEFVFVAIGLTSVLVGVFFWLLGYFKLGKLVRFFPFPVVGGFLAGTSWIIVKFSVTMMTGMDLTLANTGRLIEMGVLVEWLPGLVFAVVLLLASRRFSHYLVIPSILLLGVVVFYASWFGQATNGTGIVGHAVVDMHEHLGQSIAYARMNQIVPPWSR